MKVSVIIPSFYKVDAEYLKLCVQSLRDTVDWDIIVVTNGTKTSEPIEDLAPCRRLHTSDQGQCNAVNIGAGAVAPDTDYIMVSNSDMYYAPGWNKNLRFNDLCFSPNLVEPDNNAGSAKPFRKFNGGLDLEEFRREEVDGYIMGALFGYDTGRATKEERQEVGFNLPFFIRKSVWDAIGGYDRVYDPWGSNSDTDLQTKIELAGITPKRYRDMLVYHFSNKSGTFDGNHQDAWQHNWDYYRQKWGYTRDDKPKGDPWYCKNMINREKLIYHPEWEGRFENANF